MLGTKHAYDAGDFVCFRPIDWVWGTGESNSDIFQLVKVDMDAKDATEFYCQCELGDIKVKPNKKMRAVKLELTALPKLTKGVPLDVPIADIESARVVKPETKDSFTVGSDPFDVGVKL